MKDQARVVVIGGGIVGCSVLYHLAKLGWSDVVLVEKIELTAGSTWHATGLLPLFSMGYSVGQLHKYSIDLYQQLEEETGQAVSFHRTGNLRLATNQERMDEYPEVLFGGEGRPTTPTSPRPSPPPGAERESRQLHHGSPSALSGEGDGCRKRMTD